MTDIDYSKFSNEELEKIASGTSTKNQHQQPKGWKGVGHDIYETFAEPLRHPLQSAINAGIGLGEETYGLGKQALKLPFEVLSGHIPRITKNMAQGFENFVNTPANIAGYLGKKGIGFPQDIAEKAHIKVNPFEMGEQQLGDTFAQGLPSLALLGPFGEASTGGALANAGKRALVGGGVGLTQNQNPLQTALMGAAIPPFLKGSKEGYEGAKNVYQKWREPNNRLKESEETLQHIRHLLNQHQEEGQAANTHMSRFMNEAQEGLTGRQDTLESRLPQLFPVHPESTTRTNLSHAMSNTAQDLTQHFNKQYTEFNTEHGQTPVNEPFNWHETNLDNLPHISVTTNRTASGASNHRATYETPEGEEVTINFPARNSSVQDYVDLSRELRDAAYSMTRRMKEATHGEKVQFRTTRNRLRQLQGQAENTIKDTIGDEAYQQFRSIQDDYSHLMGPIKEYPSLFKAAYKKHINDNLFSDLTQPFNEHFRNYAYQSPQFTQALREHLMQGPSHPLNKTHTFNPTQLSQDVIDLLSPEQHGAIHESAQLNEAQHHLNQASQQIKNPETLTPQQEHFLRRLHPQFAEHLSTESQRRHIVRALEQEETAHKITKEEAKRQLSNRRKLLTFGAAGVLASPGINKISHLLSGLVK